MQHAHVQLVQVIPLITALAFGCAGATEIGEGIDGSGGVGSAPGTGGTASLAFASGGFAGTTASTPGSAGAGSVSPFTPSPDCSASPSALLDYSTEAELEALLVRRWRRCIEPQIPGEELGIEFTSDGSFYPLYVDEDTNLPRRRTGVDYEHHWSYLPPGSPDPISGQPSRDGTLVLDGVFTSPPRFTDDPTQLRILLTPVLARYTPLD